MNLEGLRSSHQLRTVPYRMDSAIGLVAFASLVQANLLSIWADRHDVYPFISIRDSRTYR